MTTTLPSTDRPPDDPRLALLRALNTPPYDTAAGKVGASLGEAEQLIDAHWSAAVREAADAIDARQAKLEAEERADIGELDHETVQQGTAVRDMADYLRRMADERSGPDAFRASVLRDFLWRLEQSSGHDVAAKLIEDEPEWAELLHATEATT